MQAARCNDSGASYGRLAKCSGCIPSGLACAVYNGHWKKR
jgi:hypothetical protein